MDAVQLEDAFLRGTLQIRSALSTLHARGIIHNDIKPGNILIDFNGDFNKQQKVRRNSPEFDEMLLVVSVLDRLQLLTLQH
eukprot:gene15002-17587_t